MFGCIINDLFLYYLGILHSWCVCSSSNKSILLFMERSLQLDLEYLNHKNMVIVHVMFTLMCNVIKCNVMKSMFILKRPSIFSKTNNPYNYYSLLLPLKWMPQMTCYPIQCFSVSHGKGKKTFKSNVCQNSFYFYLDTSAVIILRSCLGNRLYEMIIILCDTAGLTNILSLGLKFVFISTLQNWRLIAGIKIGWFEKCNVI